MIIFHHLLSLAIGPHLYLRPIPISYLMSSSQYSTVNPYSHGLGGGELSDFLTLLHFEKGIKRLVDELVILYKETSLKVETENIRARILQILIQLQQCKCQFEAAWIKHKDDPNLSTLCPSLTPKTVIPPDSCPIST